MRYSMTRFLVPIVTLLLVTILSVGVAFAALPTSQTAPPIDLPSLLTQFMALAGVGALVALIVNILKTVGVVKDGNAPTWATGLNLIGLVLLFFIKVFAPQADIGNLDGLAATIAQIGVLVLGLITQLLGSKLGHVAVRGTWVIGKSYSLR
jgi:hypothetical protein